MDPYMKNSACSCSRCRSSRLLFPALIITAGVLFLLHENGAMEFNRSWPVLLLVAGLFSYLSRAASFEGHVQPYVAAYPQQGYVQPGYAQPAYVQPGYTQTTPTPAQASAQAGPTTSTPNDRLNNERSSNDPTNDDRSNNDPQVNS